jgi:hypothetical protein
MESKRSEHERYKANNKSRDSLKIKKKAKKVVTARKANTLLKTASTSGDKEKAS